MKLVGRATAGRSTTIITLERPESVGGPFKLKLQALPVGVPEQILNHRLPLPNPPMDYIKKDGRVQKDEDGAFARRPNFLDATYRERVKELQYLHKVALAYESLKVQVNGEEAIKIEWDTKEPTQDKPDNWKAFYKSILSEMQVADFTPADLTILDRASHTLSMVTEATIEEAMNRFLPKGKPEEKVEETPTSESDADAS